MQITTIGDCQLVFPDFDGNIQMVFCGTLINHPTTMLALGMAGKKTHCGSRPVAAGSKT
ncbi:MAG: hypothetical protein LBJ38_01015 [Oscillospiraceae bacterium]|jgi:hypothetical protein|nr:hypothetical protein [Oscillospiraceae bacterium]